MAPGRLKVFGWGREGEGMTAEEEASALDVHSRRFGIAISRASRYRRWRICVCAPAHRAAGHTRRGFARPRPMTAPCMHMVRASPTRCGQC